VSEPWYGDNDAWIFSDAYFPNEEYWYVKYEHWYGPYHLVGYTMSGPEDWEWLPPHNWYVLHCGESYS
jgi:hypothetical protein